MRRHWGKALLGLVVTVVALWWALKDAPFGEVWARIVGGNFWLLGASIFIATSGFLIRAMRWKLLLAPVKRDTSLRARWSAVTIGFMANNVLPARVGEFARAYALSRMETVSAGAAFGSLVVERTLDGIALLLLLVIPVLTPGFPTTGVMSEGVGAAALNGAVVLVGLMIAALVVMTIWPQRFVRLAGRVATTVLPRSLARPLVDALEAFLDSLSLLRSPGLLGLSFLWTLGFWGYHGLSFWLGMKAFGIQTGLASAYFTEAVVGFGVAIPAAPGFLGTFQASARFALDTVYGVDPSHAAAFALGYYVGGWIPITVIGLVYAWKLGLSLADVGAAEERVEDIIEEEHPGLGGLMERDR